MDRGGGLNHFHTATRNGVRALNARGFRKGTTLTLFPPSYLSVADDVIGDAAFVTGLESSVWAVTPSAPRHSLVRQQRATASPMLTRAPKAAAEYVDAGTNTGPLGEALLDEFLSHLST
jgi:hypothetical protein